MDSLTGCVFCKIVDGALPSSRLVDSPRVLAFLDIDPVTPGHALVIPKEHLPDLADLTDDLAGEMLAVARQVAAALRRTSLRCEGINLFYADGEAAFQEVFHSHLHVFPRYGGDGFVIQANWGSNPERTDLDAVATQIRAQLRVADAVAFGERRDDRRTTISDMVNTLTDDGATY